MSLQENYGLDFLFFSDCVPSGFAPNAIVYPSTLKDICELASDALSSPVCISSAKKLCDLRPIYGEIFRKYLVGYDYWGYGDIDVIYGNLSKYLEQAQFSRADIISFRKGWLSGSLTLCRNAPHVISLFRKSPYWQDIVRNPDHILYDELGGMFYRERLDGVPLEKINAKYGSFSALVGVAEKKGEIKVFRNDLACEHLHFGQRLIHNRRKLLDARTEKEWAYYHMVIDKRRFFQCDSSKTPSGCFYITATGLYNEDDFSSWRYPLISAQRYSLGLFKMAKRKLQ